MSYAYYLSAFSRVLISKGYFKSLSLHLQFAWCGVFNGNLQQSVIDGLSGQVAEVQQLHTELV